MYDLNFLACALNSSSVNYEDFLVPYAFFALRSNPFSFVEMVVKDSVRFRSRYFMELGFLEHHFSSRFLVRNFKIDLHGHLKNTYRFFEVPVVLASHTFICDIDIMFFEKILSAYSSWPDLPYHNIIRRNSRKLTGHHLVRTVDYYTVELEKNVVKFKNLYPNMCDENLLYLLMDATFGLPSREYSFHPLLGIHFSPNRGRGRQMDLITTIRYRNEFLKTVASHPDLFKFDIFLDLNKQLSNFKIVKKIF